MSARPDGIYEVEVGHWIVISRGERNDFKAPAYDLPFLVRAYAGRLEYVGPWQTLAADPALADLASALGTGWTIEGSLATSSDGVKIARENGVWIVDWGTGPQAYFHTDSIIQHYQRYLGFEP